MGFNCQGHVFDWDFFASGQPVQPNFGYDEHDSLHGQSQHRAVNEYGTVHRVYPQQADVYHQRQPSGPWSYQQMHPSYGTPTMSSTRSNSTMGNMNRMRPVEPLSRLSYAHEPFPYEIGQVTMPSIPCTNHQPMEYMEEAVHTGQQSQMAQQMRGFMEPRNLTPFVATSPYTYHTPAEIRSAFSGPNNLQSMRDTHQELVNICLDEGVDPSFLPPPDTVTPDLSFLNHPDLDELFAQCRNAEFPAGHQGAEVVEECTVTSKEPQSSGKSKGRQGIKNKPAAPPGFRNCSGCSKTKCEEFFRNYKDDDSEIRITTCFQCRDRYYVRMGLPLRPLPDGVEREPHTYQPVRVNRSTPLPPGYTCRAKINVRIVGEA